MMVFSSKMDFENAQKIKKRKDWPVKQLSI